MLMKKALFLVSSESEIETLKEFGKKFREKYNVETDALYVKDVLKYEIFPVTIEGIGVNIGSNYAFKEYMELEERNFNNVKEKLGSEFSKVYSEDGETIETALNELKKYDLIVVVKNEKVSPYLKELLRSNFKPLIILPNIANKTLYTFFYMFDEQKVDVLRVNVDSKDYLKERFGDNCNLVEKEGDPFKTIMEESEKYDFILMGDLRYTIMVERITRKLGVKLLENLKKPIFIV